MYYRRFSNFGIVIFICISVFQSQSLADTLASEYEYLDFNSGYLQTMSCGAGSHSNGFIDVENSTFDGDYIEDGVEFSYVNKGWAHGCECPTDPSNTDADGNPYWEGCPSPPLEKRIWLTGTDAYEGSRSIVIEARRTTETTADGDTLYTRAPGQTLDSSHNRDKANFVASRNPGMLTGDNQMRYLSFAFKLPAPESGAVNSFFMTNGIPPDGDPRKAINILQLWQGSPHPPPAYFGVQPISSEFDCGGDPVDSIDPVSLVLYARGPDRTSNSDLQQNPIYPKFEMCIQRGTWYRIGLAYRIPDYIRENAAEPDVGGVGDNGVLRGWLLSEDGFDSPDTRQLFYFQKGAARWGYNPVPEGFGSCSNDCKKENGWGSSGMQIKFGNYRDRQQNRQRVVFDAIITSDIKSIAFIGLITETPEEPGN